MCTGLGRRPLTRGQEQGGSVSLRYPPVSCGNPAERTHEGMWLCHYFSGLGDRRLCQWRQRPGRRRHCHAVHALCGGYASGFTGGLSHFAAIAGGGGLAAPPASLSASASPFAGNWRLIPTLRLPDPCCGVSWPGRTGRICAGSERHRRAACSHVCPVRHRDKDMIRANLKQLFVIISCPIIILQCRPGCCYGRCHAHLSACGSGLRYRSCLCLSRGTAYRRGQLSASSGGGHRPVRAFPC